MGIRIMDSDEGKSIPKAKAAPKADPVSLAFIILLFSFQYKLHCLLLLSERFEVVRNEYLDDNHHIFHNHSGLGSDRCRNSTN